MLSEWNNGTNGWSYKILGDNPNPTLMFIFLVLGLNEINTVNSNDRAATDQLRKLATAYFKNAVSLELHVDKSSVDVVDVARQQVQRCMTHRRSYLAKP